MKNTSKKFNGYREIFTDEFGKFKAIDYDSSCVGFEQYTESDLIWAIRGGSVIIYDTTFRGKSYGNVPNKTVSKRYL